MYINAAIFAFEWHSLPDVLQERIMKMNMLLLLIAFVPLLYRLTNAFPAGAPDSTCISMQPRVQAHGNAQTTAPPYVIQVDKSYYYENNTVKVYIKACGDATIKGFLIEAREKGQQIPLGSFTDVPPQTQHLDCTAMNAETAVRIHLIEHASRPPKCLITRRYTKLWSIWFIIEA